MKVLLAIFLMILVGCKNSEVSKQGDVPTRDTQPVCPNDPPNDDPNDPPVCEEYVLNDHLNSTQTRDKGTEQISIFAEIVNAQNGTMPGNYHQVVDPINDVESLSVAWLRPAVDCGVDVALDTVNKKVDDCIEKNGPSATWAAEFHGINGEVDWELVVKIGNNEVWRDSQTQLLWSSDMGAANWCRAAGDDHELSSNTVSLTVKCKEINRGENFCLNDAIGADAKGRLENIAWRLPSRSDFMRADVNGIRNPFSFNNNFFYWTTTSFSMDKIYSFVYGFKFGDMEKRLKSDGQIHVRCVGRGN